MSIKVSGELYLNEVKLEGLNSPTDQFKDDVVYDVGSDYSPVLDKIDKLVLVDTAGTERDYTTPTATLDYGNARVTLTGTVTASASYTCNRVRAYSGTKCYFEYTLSPSVSISSGVTYRVTYIITLSISLTSSSPPANLDPTYTELHKMIADTLATGSKIHDITSSVSLRLYMGETLVASKTGCTLSYDQNANTATITFSWTQETTITFDRFRVYFSDGTYDYYYLAAIFTSSQTITGGTPVTFTITVSL
ncbi:MAG: hypothetical protein QW365_08390 [Candidatus Nezhaarchaeales archaeon]